MAEALQVVGATGLARDLARAAKEQDRAKAKIHRKWAAEVRSDTRSAAAAGSRQQARMAGGIGSKADRNSASLTVKNTKGAPGGQGAFYGAKRWPQFKPWVGNTWTVATKGQGPYVINETLAENAERYAAEFQALCFQPLERIPSHPKP